MVLGKLPVPGHPTTVDYSRARAYCAGSRCGWERLDIFSLVYHFSFLSPCLWETARYRLKYCLKGPLSPKQPINHQFLHSWGSTELQIRKGIEDNLKIFFLISQQKHVMTPY